eukprot:14216278-Ditylum_brightwellii.AAC.1
MNANMVSFGSAASWCQNYGSWAVSSTWQRQRRRSLVWGNWAEMLRTCAGNRSRCMSGVLLGMLSGVACGGAVGGEAMRCCGRMWANVASRWARKVEEASTTIDGVTMRDWAPLVQAAVNRAQSGLMYAAMLSLLARLWGRGNASHGVIGAARTSGRRQS